MMGYVTADVSTQGTCQEVLTELMFIRIHQDSAAAKSSLPNVKFVAIDP